MLRSAPRSVPFVLSLLALPACAASRAEAPRAEYRSNAPGPPAYPAYPPPSEPGKAVGGVYAAQPGSVVTKPEDSGGSAGGYSFSDDKAVAKEQETSATVASTGDSDVSVTGSAASGPSTPTAPAAIEPQGGAQQEMFDIEARVSIEVEKVSDAAAKLRELAKKHGGQIVADTVNDESGYAGASFTLRIPAKGAEAFLDEAGGVGAVRSRQVTARDIGKEFHDAQIYLRNLELTLKRYEDILAKAQDVKAILEIEREMTRVRSEIDRVKGDLRWMKDRAARATVYITLFATRPDTPPTFNPKAKIHPGLWFAHVADFRGDNGREGYYGAGISVAIARWFSVDVSGYKRIGSDSSGLGLFLLTVGGETYSDFLGGGRRTWFNPYVGLRLGYARMLNQNEMVAGASLGLEIFKTKFVRLDVQSRLLGLFGNKDVGGHVAIQSGLALHIAF